MIIFLFLISFSVFASSDPLEDHIIDASFSVFVMDCQSDIKLVDYYELYDLDPSYKYNMTGETVEELVDEFINRSLLFSKPRGQLFKKWKSHFSNEVKFVKNINFGPQHDDFGFSLPNNCKVKTLLKALNPYQNGKGVFVDKELWDRLDVISKAGAISNYLINLDYIFLLKKKSTIYTRYLNALISSNSFEAIQDIKLKSHLLKTIGYDYLYFMGIFFDVKSFDLFSEGELKYARILPVPFELRGFDYFQEVLISNIKGMKISYLVGKTIDNRKRNTFVFRDVNIISQCSGEYAIPDVSVNMVLKLKKNKFIFQRLYSQSLQFQGRFVNHIYEENGKLILPISLNPQSSNNVQEITYCN